MVKKKKKEKKAFWKKLDPELQRVTDHLGHIIDNSNVKQITDTLLNLGLSYQGIVVTKNIMGGLIGPLGLKLAQSPNIVAGSAGLAILSGLGIGSIQALGDKPQPKPDDQGQLSCPEGFTLILDTSTNTHVCAQIVTSGVGYPETPQLPPPEQPTTQPSLGYDYWKDPVSGNFCVVNNDTGVVYCNGNQNQVEMWAARGG